MSTHITAEPFRQSDESDRLADVIEMPGIDQPSFYQRNSGALPKAENGLTDAHRRSTLPRPRNHDRTTMRDRILSLFNR